MRKWSIKIVTVGPDGQELPAIFIDRVTYKLHPSFEKPTRGTHILCDSELISSLQETTI